MEKVIDDAPLVARARAILRERRQMAALFARLEFADPAYDLLLSLFVENAHGRAMTLEQVGAATRLPATTARRWIDHLVREDAVDARAGSADAGGQLWLTAEARRRVRGVLSGTLGGEWGEREGVIDVDRR